MELKNNTILITGGTSGFGFLFAQRFIEMGNTVIITGRNLDTLEATKEVFPSVDIYQSDVSNPEDIVSLYNHVIKKFPDLNIIINNAGIMRKVVIHDHYNLTDITQEIEIDLMGPIRMVQQFLPHLKKQKKAVIMNVTSGIALMTLPIAPIYSASKSGLRAYTKALRVQLKKTNIKVIELVAPGSSTPLNDKFLGEDGVRAATLLEPEKIVDDAIRGILKGKNEVYPGLSGLLKILSRLAPGFLLKQASKMGAASMYTE
ncbi:SDR family NAD(P)-dependent oxidoreductase [Flavobacterium alkalisoli]|uniref:SDR family NAD(P)-dependent oxidoreductase n=1 Tax=Flavobacterium alkalisoli TaxID=2602769 RepID=A0A5B9FXG4_9FLAO|nr:SDR family NAD(P)-dependent oxidoreductase [Flavobacterium alkalisoli]QEE50971.1 SDR family NAD(P)-dependent oxidoreductase [Flavobacterium alkalisoli]